MSEINRLADFILKYYGHEIGLGNPREGESAVDVAIRLLTPQTARAEVEHECCVDGTQASEQVIEMLANLARRVTQLESQLRDTQNNVERQAEDLENARHRIHDHSKMFGEFDERVRRLDERTRPDRYVELILDGKVIAKSSINGECSL